MATINVKSCWEIATVNYPSNLEDWIWCDSHWYGFQRFGIKCLFLQNSSVVFLYYGWEFFWFVGVISVYMDFKIPVSFFPQVSPFCICTCKHFIPFLKTGIRPNRDFWEAQFCQLDNSNRKWDTMVHLILESDSCQFSCASAETQWAEFKSITLLWQQRTITGHQSLKMQLVHFRWWQSSGS